MAAVKYRLEALVTKHPAEARFCNQLLSRASERHGGRVEDTIAVASALLDEWSTASNEVAADAEDN